MHCAVSSDDFCGESKNENSPVLNRMANTLFTLDEMDPDREVK